MNAEEMIEAVIHGEDPKTAIDEMSAKKKKFMIKDLKSRMSSLSGALKSLQSDFSKLEKSKDPRDEKEFLSSLSGLDQSVSDMMSLYHQMIK